MWPFKYFPFQVLSRGAIYCAVNGILKIDCSNENSTSVFVTLLVFPFLKKNNLPWSNQVFHEIFQLTVWVPLQWLEEDSKERQHEDQPLKKSNDCHEKLAISRKWGDKSCAGEKFYWLATGASRYICVYIFVPHKLRGRLVSSTRCTQVQHV